MTIGDIRYGYTVEVGLTGDGAETRHFLGGKSHFVCALWIRVGKSLQELRVHFVFVFRLTTAKMPKLLGHKSYLLSMSLTLGAMRFALCEVSEL